MICRARACRRARACPGSTTNGGCYVLCGDEYQLNINISIIDFSIILSPFNEMEILS